MELSRDDIYRRLTAYFEELFEIEPERVTLDTRLYEDLGLDSIDAVDLLSRVQDLAGRRLNPAEFKSVRTVGDIVDCVERLLAAL